MWGGAWETAPRFPLTLDFLIKVLYTDFVTKEAATMNAIIHTEAMTATQRAILSRKIHKQEEKEGDE